eukprot:scaffold6349_cov167-Amphora_coffeaeformis.AAC.4
MGYIFAERHKAIIEKHMYRAIICRIAIECTLQAQQATNDKNYVRCVPHLPPGLAESQCSCVSNPFGV